MDGRIVNQEDWLPSIIELLYHINCLESCIKVFFAFVQSCIEMNELNIRQLTFSKSSTQRSVL